MILQQQPVQGRTASFNTGQSEAQFNGRPVEGAHTLQQNAVPGAEPGAQFNNAPVDAGRSMQENVQGGFKPTSILHQLSPSPNGMSSQDAPRRLAGGGFLPTSNGMSPETYSTERFLQSNQFNW